MHRVRAGKLKNDNVGYLFIAPQMILFLVFVLYPIVEGLRLSLYNISMSRSVFTGLGNYIKLANNPVFFKALGNTVYQVAGITLLSVLGGFILSAVIVQKSEKYMAFIRATLYLPTIMTMLVISLIWRWMLNQSTGVLNYLIRTMGMDTVNFLGNPNWVNPIIILIVSTMFVGQSVIMYCASMLSIDPSYYEAAQMDGAGRLKQILHITWPMTAPTTAYLTIITMINAMKIYVVIDQLTAGGPNNGSINLMYLCYMETFTRNRMGLGAAIGVIMFLIVLACSGSYLNRLRKS